MSTQTQTEEVERERIDLNNNGWLDRQVRKLPGIEHDGAVFYVSLSLPVLGAYLATMAAAFQLPPVQTAVVGGLATLLVVVAFAACQSITALHKITLAIERGRLTDD